MSVVHRVGHVEWWWPEEWLQTTVAASVGSAPFAPSSDSMLMQCGGCYKWATGFALINEPRTFIGQSTLMKIGAHASRCVVDETL